MQEPVSQVAASDAGLNPEQVAEVVTRACPAAQYKSKRVLLIVPDGTRTAPVGLLFQTLHRQIGAVTGAFDVLIALGTHPPMSEEAICRRLEITASERSSTYARVKFHNHAWDDPAALKKIGSIPAAEIARLTGGLVSMDVPV